MHNYDGFGFEAAPHLRPRLRLPNRLGVHNARRKILTVKTEDGRLACKPEPGHRLGVGDVLILMGHADSLPQFAIRASSSATVTYRGRVG